VPPRWTWKHVLALVAALAAFVFFRYGHAQPFQVDHTKAWGYERVPHSGPTNLERLLGDAASFLAARPVQVRCEDVSDGELVEPGGVVEFHDGQPADYARIRPDVCAALARFVREPARVWGCRSGDDCSAMTVGFADALTVLAHESMHLRGFEAEATAECYAIQLVPRLAERLGADDADGRALATVALTRLYPLMPPAYRSAECRPGGTLDIHLGAPWPA
jgi:hypothetical protein